MTSPGEMIERVAKAMWLSVGSHARRDGVEPLSWEELGEKTKSDWLDTARAAIEAMREPTDAMGEAAVPRGEWWDDANEGSVWRNMIEEALK